jgi:hypothetical protein
MMKTRSPLRLLAPLALLLVARTGLAQAPPPPPATPPADAKPDESKTRFQRGVELFKEADFRSALVEFRRAYEINRNYKVLYNIGQTEYELQDYAAALRSFERYLQGGGAEIDPSRRAQVEDDLKKLAARVAKITIKSNAADAEVLVDDLVVGKTPLSEPVLVSIGRRKITLQKGGAVSAPRFVDLAGGDNLAVAVELAEPVAQRPGPTAPPVTTPVEPPPSPSRTGLWIGVGVTSALVVGTVITGVLAIGAHDDAETKLGTFGAKASDIADARSKTKTLALVTDILGGASIAMAGVTVVLGVTGGKGDSTAPKTATIGIGPRSIVLGGTF